MFVCSENLQNPAQPLEHLLNQLQGAGLERTVGDKKDMASAGTASHPPPRLKNTGQHG